MKSSTKKTTMRSLAQEPGIPPATVSRASRNARAGYNRPARGAAAGRDETLHVLLLLALANFNENAVAPLVVTRGEDAPEPIPARPAAAGRPLPTTEPAA